VAEAMAAVHELPRLDAILSDISLPGEDGYSFIRRVRSLGTPRARVTAVALTALARSEDRRRALLAGFHSHVAKPVEPAELIAVVATLCGRTGVEVAEAPAEGPREAVLGK
jgi:CheY-like chemotaxis protein